MDRWQQASTFGGCPSQKLKERLWKCIVGIVTWLRNINEKRRCTTTDFTVQKLNQRCPRIEHFICFRMLDQDIRDRSGIESRIQLYFDCLLEIVNISTFLYSNFRGVQIPDFDPNFHCLGKQIDIQKKKRITNVTMARIHRTRSWTVPTHNSLIPNFPGIIRLWAPAKNGTQKYVRFQPVFCDYFAESCQGQESYRIQIIWQDKLFGYCARVHDLYGIS